MCHADADPKAGQPDPVHGAVRPAAAVGAALAGVLLAVGLYMALHSRRPTTSRATPPRSCSCTCRRPGSPCSATRWWPLSSFGLLVFRHPLADVSAKAAAPIGAAFTFLCLVTGSLWGKPMWGAFWVWDPRLTSVLILFFLYLGLIALRSSIEDEALAGQADGGAGAGRHRHAAGHQVLGGVEQPAPAGQRHAARRADHPRLAAVAAAGDGGWP